VSQFATPQKFKKMAKKETSLMIADEVIMSKIYYLREQKVMLDADLAELYHVTTGNLNKAVNRNLKRFPDDFMFQLNETEFKNLMFQNGISRWGGTRKLPYAFTENGMAMLSGILNSDWAIAVNIRIMRIFTRITKMYIDNTELRLAIEEIKRKTENNTKNIEVVFQYLDELLEKKENPKPRQQIGYKLPKKK
jgi:predicted XRE-type DNA-binding protein